MPANCAKSTRQGFQSNPASRRERVAALRKQLKNRRQATTAVHRQRAERLILRRLARTLETCRRAALKHRTDAKRPCLGAFLSTPDEVDLRPLLPALSRRWRIALPKIDFSRPGHMTFLPWKPGDTLHINRWGLAEPRAHHLKPIAPRNLACVLVPIVGVDRRGGRLGMGGGYYDRAFSHRRWAARRDAAPRPRLVGIAFAIQRVRFLPLQRWDIQLDALVTESAQYEFSPSRDRRASKQQKHKTEHPNVA
ncbi:MAG: 5-formyltetrahydrofolate cyclo-ligase [Thioalkalivibrionaceae bacterium]